MFINSPKFEFIDNIHKSLHTIGHGMYSVFKWSIEFVLSGILNSFKAVISATETVALLPIALATTTLGLDRAADDKAMLYDSALFCAISVKEFVFDPVYELYQGVKASLPSFSTPESDAAEAYCPQQPPTQEAKHSASHICVPTHQRGC